MPAKPAKTTRAAQGAVVFPLAAAAAPSLADIAYRRLEEAIVTLRIAPGEVVSEAALSELIGLGRMPTREAVRRLERENLLSVLPKRGILISHIDPVVQLRLLAVRREVERLMVRLAARDASTPERTQFRQLGARFRQAAQTGDSVLFVQSDKTFNELCLSTARNEFVTDAMRLMQGLSRRFWFQSLAACRRTGRNRATACRGGAGHCQRRRTGRCRRVRSPARQRRSLRAPGDAGRRIAHRLNFSSRLLLRRGNPNRASKESNAVVG